MTPADRWLESWIDGDLVETRDDDFYHGPIDRVLEGDGIAHIAEMLEARQKDNPEAMAAILMKFLDAVEAEVRKDAPTK